MKFVDAVRELRNSYAGKSIPSTQTGLEDQASFAAQVCLQCSDMTECPLKIGHALKLLGFQVWKKSFKNKNVSGVMAINAHPVYPMVIGVNANDSYEHQRFALAHELGHYIFDIEDSNEKIVTSLYYNTEIDANKSPKEYRASKFAANLLLPELEFRTAFDKAKAKYVESGNIVASLAIAFDMPITSVRRRLEELRLAT